MSESNSSITPELLKTAEAARLANVGTRTWWRWTRSGIAPAPLKIGATTVRFKRTEVIAWISAGCPRCDGDEQPR